MSKIKVIKNETKLAAIEQQAAILFKQKGYMATSMKDIAEQIGIEAPSLYNHISSKADLLKEICFSVADCFEAEMEKADERNESPELALEQMLRFHIKMMLNNFIPLWVANHEWKHLSPIDLKKYTDKRRQYENKMRSLIDQGIIEGKFAALDAKMATLIMLAALRGLEFWQRDKQPTHTEILEDNIIQQLFKGLTPIYGSTFSSFAGKRSN